MCTRKMTNRILPQLALFIIILATTGATENLVSSLVGNRIKDYNKWPIARIFDQETKSKSQYNQDWETDGERIEKNPSEPTIIRNRRDTVSFGMSPETLSNVTKAIKNFDDQVKLNKGFMDLHFKKMEEIKNLTTELENTPEGLGKIENLKNELKTNTQNAAFFLETERQKANVVIAKLQKENLELKNNTASKTEASGVKKKAILELRTKNKAAEDALTKLQQEFDGLKMKTDLLLGNSSNLVNRISILEIDIKMVDNQLINANNNLQTCENKEKTYLNERNQQEEQLQAKKKELQNKIDDMQNKIHLMTTCCEKKKC